MRKRSDSETVIVGMFTIAFLPGAAQSRFTSVHYDKHFVACMYDYFKHVHHVIRAMTLPGYRVLHRH
jgi:hypothetical protein